MPPVPTLVGPIANKFLAAYTAFQTVFAERLPSRQGLTAYDERVDIIDVQYGTVRCGLTPDHERSTHPMLWITVD